MMTTAIRAPNGQLRVYSKGSFETILSKCVGCVCEDGETQAFTIKQKMTLRIPSYRSCARDTKPSP